MMLPTCVKCLARNSISDCVFCWVGNVECSAAGVASVIEFEVFLFDSPSHTALCCLISNLSRLQQEQVNQKANSPPESRRSNSKASKAPPSTAAGSARGHASRRYPFFPRILRVGLGERAQINSVNVCCMICFLFSHVSLLSFLQKQSLSICQFTLDSRSRLRSSRDFRPARKTGGQQHPCPQTQLRLRAQHHLFTQPGQAAQSGVQPALRGRSQWAVDPHSLT